LKAVLENSNLHSMIDDSLVGALHTLFPDVGIPAFKGRFLEI